MVRWIAAEVFEAGEGNPYPAGTPAVRRRLRAVPLDRHPMWTVLFDFYGWRSVWRFYDRRANALIGYAWVRRSSLLWRRAAWGLWVLGVVAVVVHVVLRGPTDEQVVRDFSGELLVLVVVALLLIARRVSAVLDRDNEEVGIRG